MSLTMTTTRPTAPLTTGSSGTVVITVIGDLDIAHLHAAEDLLESAVLTRPGRLVVDLSASRFVDAQAIRLFLNVHRQLWRQDGRLVLQGCSPATYRLLALTGMLDVFLLEPAAFLSQQATT